MLDNKDKEKLEKYVDKLVKGIYGDIRRQMEQGLSGRQAIDETIKVTVNKLAPESKMMLSSTYNMLMEHTLSGKLYTDVQNKAAFYELDILRDLNSKFVFDIPQDITYEESGITINRWAAAGAVVVAGGIISISMETLFPVGVAVVLAGIMAFLLKDGIELGKGKKGKADIDTLIQEYFEDVRASLLSWITSVEKYYDDKVDGLEKRLVG